MIPVMLPCGTVVDNSSEAWRHHHEALAMCKMPTQAARREHLAAVEKRGGVMARQRLEKAARALWDAGHR